MKLKQFLLVLGLGICQCVAFAQAKRTVLSAQINGYQRNMVYVSCIQSPLISGEFHTNPGEEHLLDFDTDEQVALVINGRTTVFLQPGDSLHTDINYEGNKVVDVRFSGSPNAVANNRLYQDIQRMRMAMKYRTQLLGLVVLDVKPTKRIEDSKVLMSRVNTMIEKAGSNIDKSFADYLRAEVEGLAYLSYIEYPPMYADTRKVPIKEQGIGDYWAIMDGIQLREDAVSLSSPDYMSFLMRYALYKRDKVAHSEGKSLSYPAKMEDMYRLFVEQLGGVQRDYALFTLMKNFIQGGKELERVDPLFEEYKAKYNTNPKHLKYLEQMLE